MLESIVETAMDGSDAVSGDNFTSRDATTDDALAAVYHMLGEICRYELQVHVCSSLYLSPPPLTCICTPFVAFSDGGRVKLAIDHFQKALQLNPCSMAAFEKLAALGVNMTMTGGECGQQQRQRADACRAWLAKRSGACSGAGVVAAGRVPHVTLLSKDGRGASSSCSNGNTVEHVTSAPALVVPSRPASVTSRRVFIWRRAALN